MISNKYDDIEDRHERIRAVEAAIDRDIEKCGIDARIDRSIAEMEEYDRTHPPERTRKVHRFKKCPVCGSTNIGSVDMRPIGRKNTSLCRDCKHIGGSA